MKEFAQPASRLASLSWETRFIYSAYLLFSLAAYVVIIFLVLGKTGLFPARYADYYLGNETRDLYPKTPNELLLTTHFHLFSYPLFLLVQGHVFLMCSWPRAVKGALVASAFLGGLLYLASPWLVLLISPSWAFLSSVARLLLAPPLILFVLVPLREMWRPCPAPPD